MTALNNLKGKIVKDGKIIYDELLNNGLHFLIILMYDKGYAGENFADSSCMLISTTISNGTFHTWTNGVVSANDVSTQEEKNGDWRELKKETTKDGLIAKEVVYRQFIHQGKEFRTVKWVIEVPKAYLISKLA